MEELHDIFNWCQISSLLTLKHVEDGVSLPRHFLEVVDSDVFISVTGLCQNLSENAARSLAFIVARSLIDRL